MKISSNFLALCVLNASVWGAAAFNPMQPHSLKSPLILGQSMSTLGVTSEIVSHPDDLPLQRLEGGGTVKTFSIPGDAKHAQILLQSRGRPIKARVEVWLGPIRRMHMSDMDIENGLETPFRALLKLKPQSQVLRILTTSTQNFPVWAGLYIPTNEESKSLDDFTQSVYDNNFPTKIQGACSVEGGGGSVRYFDIPQDVESVQVLVWSKYVGKKSTKALIEVLQGPNNKKQTYNIQCSGSYQPYHAVFRTPGSGCSIRIKNKKYLEDGGTEVVVVPYEMKGDVRGPSWNGVPGDAESLVFDGTGPPASLPTELGMPMQDGGVPQWAQDLPNIPQN